MGNPKEFKESIMVLKVGDTINRDAFLLKLVTILYSRTVTTFDRSTFRVNGDTVDLNIPYADWAYRIVFFGNEIEELESFDPDTGSRIETLEEIVIYPANLYLTPQDRMQDFLITIQDDLAKQVNYFNNEGKHLEAARIKERVEFDLEMIKELGYCSGIENYSRYIDQRNPGERPFCLIDYFPDDFLMVIDESHVSLPQVRAMYGGDRSRKINLVEYGFRLPAALDNRPLNFDEFEGALNQNHIRKCNPGRL
jgi:excinuclease ABC subunit B